MTGGAALSALALIMVLGVLPFQRRWTERESALEAKRGQLARLEALVASEDAIRRALDEQQRERSSLSGRLLTGATPALAASNLLVLLQRYAEQSRVTLNRVGVVGEPKPAGEGLPALPVDLSAQGDIYGLVDLLFHIQHGEKLLVIEDIRVNAMQRWTEEGESGGGLLTWSVRLHGPYVTE